MRERLEAALTDGVLERMWAEILDGWEGASAEEREKAHAFVRCLRDHFLQVARDIDDAEDFEMAAVIHYVELKSVWMRLNTQITHQVQRIGAPDPRAMYRAGLVSCTLSRIEPFLAPEDVEKVTDFLADPLAPAG